ncbi:MAG: RagB/SusD family nutrient uptake outer membrane protein [Ferruginibacter sp.]|nr:RagB/SusD family nutrient uptake outer membrane protein [Ferruginibacter sp.]
MILIITASMSVSCKKYLSPEPISTFDPGFVFGNVPNAQAALMGAYYSLSGDFGYGIRVSYYYAHDDDIIMGGGSGLDQLRHQEAHYTLVAGNTDIVSTFNQFYAGIERANNCIYYIPKMPQYSETAQSSDAVQLRRMVGEALTVRAQYYFELTRIWGDVPVQWEPSAFQANLFPRRTSRDTIYTRLLSDLALAKTLMPWRTQATQDERFTKGSAMALRAKIALFAGGYSLKQSGQITRPSNYLDYYTIVKAECAELMQNRAQHNLAPTFKGLFKDVIDAHKAMDPNGELIMQVAMANGTNSDSKIGLQNGTKINGVGGSLGNMLPTYFYQFDSTDVRRDVTVVPFEVVRDVFGRGHASNSIYDGKFRRDWVSSPAFYFSSGVTTGTNPVTTTPASNSALQNMQLNWPLIRFADVLLMFAEADNELTSAPSPEAVAAWREVNLRGHNNNAALVPVPPTDKVGFFKLLVKERMLEFGGEGIRKYDLIRWNLLGTALTEAKANLARWAAGTAMQALTYQAAPPAYTLVATLPTQMYYYQNALAENNVIWANSFYKPTPSPAPLDITNNNALLTTTNRVAWYANANVTTTYTNYLGFGFVSGKSELYPIPQSAIDANNNLKPQNPLY